MREEKRGWKRRTEGRCIGQINGDSDTCTGTQTHTPKKTRNTKIDTQNCVTTRVWEQWTDIWGYNHMIIQYVLLELDEISDWVFGARLEREQRRSVKLAKRRVILCNWQQQSLFSSPFALCQLIALFVSVFLFPSLSLSLFSFALSFSPAYTEMPLNNTERHIQSWICSNTQVHGFTYARISHSLARYNLLLLYIMGYSHHFKNREHIDSRHTHAHKCAHIFAHIWFIRMVFSLTYGIHPVEMTGMEINHIIN